jgi:hypothetical protein
MAAVPRGQAMDSLYMVFFNVPWLPERLLSDRRIGGWYRAMALSNPRLLGTHVQVPTTYVWSDGDAFLGRAARRAARGAVRTDPGPDHAITGSGP